MTEGKGLPVPNCIAGFKACYPSFQCQDCMLWRNGRCDYEATMAKDFMREVEIKGLMLGIELGPEVVSREICPQCPFKTEFCQWLLENVWLPGGEVRFACPGVRAWVRMSN